MPICECEFEFEAADADWDIDEYEDGAGEIRYTNYRCRVTCPNCKTEMYKCERIEE